MNNRLCFSIIWISLIPFTLFAQNQDSVSGDRQALVDLYNATGGSGWDKRSAWNSSSPLRNWYGVETDSQGRVVRLNLAGNNLRGELPASIGNLSRLRYINIKQNRLTGRIPSSIGNWREIEWLLLSGRYVDDPDTNPNRHHHPGKSDESGNDFSGVFPDVWANFQLLRYFELSGSSLTHILYESIGQCTELLQIHISWNTQMSQEIPAGINNATKLQQIWLRSNDLYGSIPPLDRLTDLRFFHVGNGNRLSGQIPDFSNNIMLRELNLDQQGINGGGITGEWPHYWNNGQFTNLIGLRATHNNITGTLHGFENLNLRTFSLESNNLEGSIPQSITTNNQLIILHLGRNNFTGQIPQTGWGNWKRLRYMDLSYNNLTGPLPDRLPGWDLESSDDISGSNRWQRFRFNDNNLSGPVSTNHAHFINESIFDSFEYLDISNNAFSEQDYLALNDLMGSKLRTGGQDPDGKGGRDNKEEDYVSEDDDDVASGDRDQGPDGEGGDHGQNHSDNDSSVDLNGNGLSTGLGQNYPNPFNPSTQIRFSIAETQNVTLSVYNMAGQRVATLVNGNLGAGQHQVAFNASNLSSGVYFYRLITGREIYTRKMLLIK